MENKNLIELINKTEAQSIEVAKNLSEQMELISENLGKINYALSPKCERCGEPILEGDKGQCGNCAN